MTCKVRYKIFFLVLLSLVSNLIHSQEVCVACKVDSLKTRLNVAKTDGDKIKVLTTLLDFALLYGFETNGMENSFLPNLVSLGAKNKIEGFDAYNNWYEGRIANDKKKPDSALHFYLRAIDEFDKVNKRMPQMLLSVRGFYNILNRQEDRYQFYSKKIIQYSLSGNNENLAASYHGLGGYYTYSAQYNLAISNYLKAGDIFKTFDKVTHLMALSAAASVYGDWGNLNKGFDYLRMALPMAKKAGDSLRVAYLYMTMADFLMRKERPDEAILYADSCTLWEGKNKEQRRMAIIKSINILTQAISRLQKGKPDEAFPYITNAGKLADSLKLDIESTEGSFELDYVKYLYYSKIGKKHEAETYLLTAYQKAWKEQSHRLELKYLQALSLFYGQLGKYEKVWNFLVKFYKLSSFLDSTSNAFKVAQYEIDYKELQQIDSINALKQHQGVQAAVIKQSTTLLWISFGAILIVSISLTLIYRQSRINKLNLQKLQNTQQQLLLAEKMASLGELTAGIAHEIQNPLNFVNNFSEVNKELLIEMKDEMNKGNLDDANVIADDVIANQEKINHHGKRADAIVKGMLQHSRSSSGVKEPTNINTLAHEYLRLAYQGLRAKDKSFNATMETDFDDSIGKINIIPQDIGKVILNLVTNAFYVVDEKKKQIGEGYEPTVSVSTKKEGNHMIISVKDNGNGIPQKVLGKIFQPFFTTKPTGQGTGLGLSLSYDIVKAHGGQLTVETKEEKGSEFIIQLPVN